MDVWIERFNYLKVNVDGRFAVCGIAEMGWQECAKGPPQPWRVAENLRSVKCMMRLTTRQVNDDVELDDADCTPV